LCLATYLRFRSNDPSWSGYIEAHLGDFLSIAIIFVIVFYAGGMYERETLTRKSRSWMLPVVTVLVSLVLTSVLYYARLEIGVGRGIFAIAGVFIIGGVGGLRQLYRIAAGYGLLSRKALVIGDGAEVVRVLELIQREDESGMRALGVVSRGPTRPNTFVHGIPVLGSVDRLRDYAAAFDIETIIVTVPAPDASGLMGELRPLRYAGVELMDFVSLHEEIAEEIPLDHIDDEWLMNAAMNSSVIHIRKIKRIMDIAISLVGLVGTLVITVPAALAVRLTSRGPVLYRQCRLQQGGRPYTLLKFRTMPHNVEAAGGAVWADRDDVRTTRVGRVLRKWRIDEIPQLINVLKGEMSLVGPRPERPEFVEKLVEEIPFYRERLLVPPGITGWAQVKYPYAASVDAARKKLQFDLYYIKHMSFVLDCQILLRTVKTILLGVKHSDDEVKSGGDGGKEAKLCVLPDDSGQDDSKTA
jgi:exopolysaccharide biosynthesis polyprenyl glycosylphosphotransferase